MQTQKIKIKIRIKMLFFSLLILILVFKQFIFEKLFFFFANLVLHGATRMIQEKNFFSF